MSVIFLLLTVSTLVATVFLLGFIWAVRKGQYEDDQSPAVRILLDDTVQSAQGGTKDGPGPSDQSNHTSAQPVAP